MTVTDDPKGTGTTVTMFELMIPDKEWKVIKTSSSGIKETAGTKLDVSSYFIPFAKSMITDIYTMLIASASTKVMMPSTITLERYTAK